MEHWNDKLAKLSGIITGIILIALGLLGIRFGVWHSASEAVIIASILTITVDPFLKRRLIKEASRDIFYHLLGFELPTEVRETLGEFISKTKDYRKDVRIDVNLTRNSLGVLVDGNEYLYQKVFLEGDHINVRWWPRTDPSL